MISSTFVRMIVYLVTADRIAGGTRRKSVFIGGLFSFTWGDVRNHFNTRILPPINTDEHGFLDSKTRAPPKAGMCCQSIPGHNTSIASERPSMAGLVMNLEQVFAEIPIEIAPDRMYMVSVILRVAVHDEDGGGLNTAIFARGLLRHPRPDERHSV